MEMSALDLIRKSHYGYYFIILAAALAALIHVICKPMLDGGNTQLEINPIVMAFLIYFICGIFFTPLVKKSPIVSIFTNSEIIFSLVIAMMVFKERLRIKECIPFSMIIIGMMIIPIGNDLYQNDLSLGSLVTGDLLIIFSGLLYAVDITLCKYIGERFDVRKTVQITSFICAAITIAIIVLFQIPMDVKLVQLPSILIMSIIGTGMSTLFFLMGLKLIGAVRTVLLYSTMSMFGILFSGLILSEAITVVDIFSTMLVFAGIFLLRNKLAGTEEKMVETEINNKTNTSYVVLSKKIKLLPGMTKTISNASTRERNAVLPNCGIG